MNAKEAFVVIAFDKPVYSLKPEITGMLQGCRRDLKVNNSRFPFDPENTFSFTTPDTAFAASALEINWLKYGSNQRGSG